tara:strand:- start:486 stop:620 length:135 start_codon:yes stop_codon:yes gene_type:complete
VEKEDVENLPKLPLEKEEELEEESRVDVDADVDKHIYKIDYIFL